jgi:hypothetical protein
MIFRPVSKGHPLDSQAAVVSSGCGFKRLWFQVAVVSSGCAFKWLWFQVAVVSSGCGFKWLWFQAAVVLISVPVDFNGGLNRLNRLVLREIPLRIGWSPLRRRCKRYVLGNDALGNDARGNESDTVSWRHGIA